MSPEPVNCTDSELSTYLQALEAGFLPTFYSDTSPFALSSSMSIASKSWRSGKKTGHFPGFPFLPMSASSTANPGADSLMSSPEGSLARTSAQQGVAPESTASDPAYGVKWRGSLARYDPDSRSWRTAQHSLLEDSDECWVTWPRSGMTATSQNLARWRITNGQDSGLLLPTPTKSWAVRGPGLSNNLENLRMNIGTTMASLEIVSAVGWRWPASFVEWMMGWPTRWSALLPLETARCRSAQPKHGDC